MTSSSAPGVLSRVRGGRDDLPPATLLAKTTGGKTELQDKSVTIERTSRRQATMDNRQRLLLKVYDLVHIAHNLICYSWHQIIFILCQGCRKRQRNEWRMQMAHMMSFFAVMLADGCGLVSPCLSLVPAPAARCTLKKTPIWAEKHHTGFNELHLMPTLHQAWPPLPSASTRGSCKVAFSGAPTQHKPGVQLHQVEHPGRDEQFKNNSLVVDEAANDNWPGSLTPMEGLLLKVKDFIHYAHNSQLVLMAADSCLLAPRPSRATMELEHMLFFAAMALMLYVLVSSCLIAGGLG